MDVLRSYFEDLIRDAVKSDGLELNSISFNYIVDLLVTHARGDVLGAPGEGMPVLAWYYRDAVNSEKSLRFNAFRRLGDTALFLTGFFSKYVDASGGLGYYIDMGCGAYDQASTAAGRHPVMNELARKFSPLVAVLNSAAVKTSIGQEQSIDQLFELHSRDPNPASWRRLVMRKATPMLRMMRE